MEGNIMDYLLIARIWAVVSVFTFFLVLWKDLPYILSRAYRLPQVGQLVSATIGGPLTWVILGLGWCWQRPQIEDAQEKHDSKLRHGQRIQLGDELFKAYRIGDDIKLKLIK
jgi:hypothetical protein